MHTSLHGTSAKVPHLVAGAPLAFIHDHTSKDADWS
jgi:hypothetical protein